MKKHIMRVFLLGLLSINALYAVPTVDFDITHGKTCDNLNALTFTNKSKGLKQFLWIIKMGNEVLATFDVANPVPYNLTSIGVYTVILKGTLNTWEEAISKDILVKEILLPLPNTITPNNDGKNDAFVTNRVGYKLEIYDRWGSIIYKSKSYKDDWGKDVPEGTYYYLLTSPTGDKCRGVITVIK